MGVHLGCPPWCPHRGVGDRTYPRHDTAGVAGAGVVAAAARLALARGGRRAFAATAAAACSTGEISAIQALFTGVYLPIRHRHWQSPGRNHPQKLPKVSYITPKAGPDSRVQTPSTLFRLGTSCRVQPPQLTRPSRAKRRQAGVQTHPRRRLLPPPPSPSLPPWPPAHHPTPRFRARRQLPQRLLLRRARGPSRLQQPPPSREPTQLLSLSLSLCRGRGSPHLQQPPPSREPTQLLSLSLSAGREAAHAPPPAPWAHLSLIRQPSSRRPAPSCSSSTGSSGPGCCWRRPSAGAAPSSPPPENNTKSNSRTHVPIKYIRGDPMYHR
jgi:hypothetical protein